MTSHARSVVALFVLAAMPGLTFAQRSAADSASDTKLLDALGVKAGMTVCEIGAGDGAQTLLAAQMVGKEGRVYTSELGDDRLTALREKVAAGGPAPITVVGGDPVKTNFPDGACDALFMRNVYHHFADPPAINASIFASMKPGARLAVLDFTPPDKEAPTPADRGKDGMHGVKPETVSQELKTAGFEPLSSGGEQRWFIVVAERPKR